MIFLSTLNHSLSKFPYSQFPPCQVIANLVLKASGYFVIRSQLVAKTMVKTALFKRKTSINPARIPKRISI